MTTVAALVINHTLGTLLLLPVLGVGLLSNFLALHAASIVLLCLLMWLLLVLGCLLPTILVLLTTTTILLMIGTLL